MPHPPATTTSTTPHHHLTTSATPPNPPLSSSQPPSATIYTTVASHHNHLTMIDHHTHAINIIVPSSPLHHVTILTPSPPLSLHRVHHLQPPSPLTATTSSSPPCPPSSPRLACYHRGDSEIVAAIWKGEYHVLVLVSLINGLNKQDAVAAVECEARREAVLWVAISSEGTVAGVCALHTVHGLPLEDLQQLKKVWKLSINP
ncbi:hypothetical protein Tco_1272134 [Tanacetum coccineum]